jgi:membrane fusion protein, multidrug efflux system
MIRTTLFLLSALCVGAIWYVSAEAEGRTAAWIASLKALGPSRSLPDAASPVQARQSNEGPAPVAVVTAPVHAKAMPITRTGVGSVEPTARVTVRARIDGAIVERSVHDGATVQAGDLLFRLDDREIQAQIARSEAVLARDRAVLAKTQAELKRTHELLARSVATQAQAEEVAADVKIAGANVAASEAALAMERTRLGHTRITAPIGGRVGVVHVNEGSLVRGSDLSGDGLVTITRMSPLQVSFSLPERDLALLHAALARPASKTPVRVVSGQIDQTISEAELSFIDSSVDAGSGTILAKATLKTDDGLWPGQYVRVELTLGTHPKTMSAPLVALQSGPGGAHVFVVRTDDTVEMRQVDLLGTQGDEIFVARGLVAGERVVIEGHPQLRDGSAISDVASARPPPARGSRTADAGRVRQ